MAYKPHEERVNPTTVGYAVQAMTTSNDVRILGIVGPRDMVGILRGISAVIITEVTTAACTLTVGTLSDDNAYGEMSVAAGLPDTFENDATLYEKLIPKNSVVELSTDGGGDAGEMDIAFVIDWFKVR